MLLDKKTNEFRKQIEALSREDILDILQMQDPDLVEGVFHIEEVFETKLNHILDMEGQPITSRPMTKEELALLVDEPFEFSTQLAEMGLDLKTQQNLHIAKDPVLWAKHFLKAKPRVYQILMMRHPSLFKVLRAGRRLGKTWTMAALLLHYSYITKAGRSIVVTPMKTQAGLIYEAIMEMAEESEVVINSISRHVTAPQYEINFKNGASIRFFTSGMKSGGKCLTPDHDVLSEEGWKPIGDIVEGERILSWKDGEYRWGEVSETHEYDFDGELVSHHGQQISFRVTPNHKFTTKTRAPNSQWKETYAEDLKDYFIPTGAFSTLPTHFEYSAEELELWGWWLAEGSGFIGKMARISQVKPEGRKRIIELVETLGLHYTTPAKEIRVEWRPPIYSGTNAYNKFIPRELFSVTGAGKHLLDGLLGGDGWMRINGWEYSSSSHQLANDVQELAVRKGLRANIREKNILYVPVGGGAPNRHWIVSAYDYKESIINKSYLEREQYQGKVHCVTIPDAGYFVVRHNGLVHVTGNSDVTRGQEAHFIVLDELDYMGDDDLDALLAMMQKTSENQPDKRMIGASTPSGRRGTFWKWCTQSTRFKEFYFPAYANPFWSEEMETFAREEYRTETAYRHEIEADWGDDAQGVYPRRFVDAAFQDPGWDYVPGLQSLDSIYVLGVDWDKIGAGTNMVVLEYFPKNHSDIHMRGMVKLCHREEVPSGEYTLTKAVARIIELHDNFRFRHIYLDKGYGEVQYELIRQHGVNTPGSNIHKVVKSIAFNSSIEVRDPFTMKPDKKEAKHYMVDTLRQYLEREELLIPAHDDQLYMELISYIAPTSSVTGKPKFEMSTAGVFDHAHDALILACLALNQNYGDLMKRNYATKAVVVSSENFLPLLGSTTSPPSKAEQPVNSKEPIDGKYSGPTQIRRPMSTPRRKSALIHKRKSF